LENDQGFFRLSEVVDDPLAAAVRPSLARELIGDWLSGDGAVGKRGFVS
jgi:hypothetical protein